LKKEEGFPKQERIVRKKQIDGLFVSGQSKALTAFPLRAVYVIKRQHTLHKAHSEASTPSRLPVQILLSVPKKRMHHAVDRNRVKRQIREAFRHNKQLLAPLSASGKRVDIAFIWLCDTHFPSSDIEKSVVHLLELIAKKKSTFKTPPSTNSHPQS